MFYDIPTAKVHVRLCKFPEEENQKNFISLHTFSFDNFTVPSPFLMVS